MLLPQRHRSWLFSTLIPSWKNFLLALSSPLGYEVPCPCGNPLLCASSTALGASIGAFIKRKCSNLTWLPPTHPDPLAFRHQIWHVAGAHWIVDELISGWMNKNLISTALAPGKMSSGIAQTAMWLRECNLIDSSLWSFEGGKRCCL